MALHLERKQLKTKQQFLKGQNNVTKRTEQQIKNNNKELLTLMRASLICNSSLVTVNVCCEMIMDLKSIRNIRLVTMSVSG